MAQQIAAEPKPFTGREINEFAGNSNIWVSVLLATEAPGNKSLSTRFRRAVVSAEEKLQSKLLPTDTVRRMIDPLAEIAGRLAGEAHERTLVLFRSPEELRYFWLPDQSAEAVIAAKNVYIRPFLKQIEGE